MSICNSWSVFQKAGTKYASSETRLHIGDFPETESRRCSMKGKSEGNSHVFFPLYTGLALPIYVPTTSLKLMAFCIIMIEETLLSKSASVTMKQTSHQIQSKKVKRRRLKSVIILCQKSSTSQIGFYSIQISTLNTLSFHRAIDEIAIR